ncbi:MAG: sulfotransferase domain-containing protein [Flavobacteriales bacterium]|nr:sulfotransferase domain-containing protein [Flavobacteriales bacterium]
MQLNHIIIGAGRSGTTSLAAYLQQHSKVNFSSIKEVTYFSVEDHYNRGVDFLDSFFKERQGALNTTSDTYLLMDKDAPKRINEYNPNIKITIILRDPSTRTHSNYNFSVNHGYIDKSISLVDSESLEAEVLAKGDVVKQNNHCNFYGSLYHLHLTNWLTYFKREQLFICTTNELRDNPQELMNAYFNFLGLDNHKIKELSAQNKAAGVKNKALNKFLVNREHPVRKLISKPLQISFLRNIILSSNVVEKIKSSNKEEMVYQELTLEEKQFCNDYFKEDLIKLKQDFGIEF